MRVVVRFAFASARVRRCYRGQLYGFAARLPSRAVLHIAGHADRIGSRADNRGLSQRRADAVARVLERSDVIEESEVLLIERWVFGETCPIAIAQEGLTDRDARRLNRRVVVTLRRSSDRGESISRCPI